MRKRFFVILCLCFVLVGCKGNSDGDVSCFLFGPGGPVIEKSGGYPDPVQPIIPEPSTLILFGVGAFGLWRYRHAHNRN